MNDTFNNIDKYTNSNDLFLLAQIPETSGKIAALERLFKTMDYWQTFLRSREEIDTLERKLTWDNDPIDEPYLDFPFELFQYKEGQWEDFKHFDHTYLRYMEANKTLPGDVIEQLIEVPPDPSKIYRNREFQSPSLCQTYIISFARVNRHLILGHAYLIQTQTELPPVHERSADRKRIDHLECFNTFFDLFLLYIDDFNAVAREFLAEHADFSPRAVQEGPSPGGDIVTPAGRRSMALKENFPVDGPDLVDELPQPETRHLGTKVMTLDNKITWVPEPKICLDNFRLFLRDPELNIIIARKIAELKSGEFKPAIEKYREQIAAHYKNLYLEPEQQRENDGIPGYPVKYWFELTMVDHLEWEMTEVTPLPGPNDVAINSIIPSNATLRIELEPVDPGKVIRFDSSGTASDAKWYEVQAVHMSPIHIVGTIREKPLLNCEAVDPKNIPHDFSKYMLRQLLFFHLHRDPALVQRFNEAIMKYEYQMYTGTLKRILEKKAAESKS